MSFRTFMELCEGAYANKATLIYQAFIDNIETAHYNKTEQSISFNVGKAAKLAKFSNLELVLRVSDSSGVRLARRKEGGNFAVVVNLSELPSMDGLEKKLETPQIMRPAIGAIEQYLDIKRTSKSDSDSGYLTDYEKAKQFNEKSTFEEHYQKLVEKLREKYSELQKMISNFEKQKEETENSSRKVTLDMAIEKLKAEYIGKNFKEFQSKAFKLLDEINKDFKNNLDKEHKNILESRLKDFYEELQ